MILIDIERHSVQGGSDSTRTLIWDNLQSHRTAYVTNLIQDQASPNNFRLVDRPPYRPKMAPIEYCFCEIAVRLSLRCRSDWTIQTLRHELKDICSMVGRGGKFANIFVHYGYPFVIN